MIPQTDVPSHPIYLSELARRALAQPGTPPQLAVDPKEYERCKTAKLEDTQPMVRLLAKNHTLRFALSCFFNLPEDDLGKLARRAIDEPTPPIPDAATQEFFECKFDLKPMVDLLEADPRLQQQLAFALDYVPSRWLLEAEIPVVVESRRRRKLNAPHLHTTLETVPLHHGHIDAYAWARCNNLTGLCLSGGGIRSSTFNLGVLQGLAALDLLEHFDYISSVSGGGYIHEWLAGWIKREDLRLAETNPDSTTSGFQAVNDALKPIPEDTAHPFTPPPIRWLRRYSNYLTPEKGFFTADTWVIIAIWVRNTLLNQIILISFLFALVLVPYLLGDILGAPHLWLLKYLQVPASLPAATLLFLVATSVFCVGLGQELDRVRHEDIYEDSSAPQKHALVGDRTVLCGIVIELLAAAILLTRVLHQPSTPRSLYLVLYLLFVFQLSAMALAGGVLRGYRANHGIPTPKLPQNPSLFTRFRAIFTRSADSDSFEGLILLRVLLIPLLGVTVLSSAVSALGAMGFFALFASLLRFHDCQVLHLTHLPHWAQSLLPLLHLSVRDLHLPSTTFALHTWNHSGVEGALTPEWCLQLIFGPPLFLLAFFVGMVLMAGLVGRNFPDWLREWIARIRALCLLLSIAWVAGFGIALLGPALIHFFSRSNHTWQKTVGTVKWTAVIGWIGTTIGSVLAGKSKKSNGTAQDSSLALTLLAQAGPYVFIVGLLILLSAAANNTFVAFATHPVLRTSELILALLAVFALFGWRVDINEFSMNPFYRNRLTRCFLGATNPKRDPSPLTGLDDRDTRNLQIARLQPSGNPKENYSGPLPIINTTLNISFGEDLAYQERKAASFFFSPLFSGYTVGWTSGKRGKGLHFNGFVPTSQFYCPEGGINIATAAAISGAAASPNAGFHTNPATAFLMTLFNVRLGWWIANPRRSPNAGYLPTNAQTPIKWPSPRFSPFQLASELLGRTDDSSAYVYLSDGGHFDNMGLYELVRRRCHRIVICDAEADENYTFEGLGMAIRKCRIDFGVEILLTDLSRLRKAIKSGTCKAHFVLGTIRYPETPRLPEADQTPTRKFDTGTIIYLKSSLTGDAKWSPDPDTKPTKLDAESADIFNYKLQHKSFPHDTTANQWFTESQFESYRRLGQHIVEETFCSDGWSAFNKVPTRQAPAAPPPAADEADAPPPVQPLAPLPVNGHQDLNGANGNNGLLHRNGQPAKRSWTMGLIAKLTRSGE